MLVVVLVVRFHANDLPESDFDVVECVALGVVNVDVQLNCLICKVQWLSQLSRHGNFLTPTPSLAA